MNAEELAERVRRSNIDRGEVRAEVARRANIVAKANAPPEAPTLTVDSTREEILAWLRTWDPSPAYDLDGPIVDLATAWWALADGLFS